MVSRYFHPIECDNTVDNPMICDDVDLKGTDPHDLCKGVKIEDWDTSASYGVSKHEYDGQPDDILQSVPGSLPVFSARLQKTFRNELSLYTVQFLPVVVRRLCGVKIDGFAIANLLSLVPALDRSASDYSQFPADYFIESRRGQMRDVKRPVIIASVAEGNDIFRLKEFPLFICVSSRFRTAFEREGYTGYSFRELRVT